MENRNRMKGREILQGLLAMDPDEVVGLLVEHQKELPPGPKRAALLRLAATVEDLRSMAREERVACIDLVG